MSESNKSYVIYSPNESEAMNRAGFWSNEFGWTTFDEATRFSQQDTQTVSLPDSTGTDARWMLWEEANVSYGGPVPEVVTVRLTLDVTYALNGENATEMGICLRKMCERAIGEGMLTGETDAEVEEYSMDVVIQPKSLSEDELASFMQQRIENGDLELEDIPIRLARYGLMEPNAFVDEMLERMHLARE